MTLILERVAGWARRTRARDLPPDVLERALLLHLSTAGAIWATETESPGPLSARAALAAGHLYTDYGLFGYPAHGGVLGAWLAAEDARLDDWVAATAIATEVAARLDAWTWLEPTPGASRAWLVAVAAAVAKGWLQGLSEAELGEALALVLSEPRVLSTAESRSFDARARACLRATDSAVDAVAVAARGDSGDPSILDYGEGLPGLPCPFVLPIAFSDLGHSYLSRSITFRVDPVAHWHEGTVQALLATLKRHRSDVGRPLRPEEVESLLVRVDPLSFRHHSHSSAITRLPSAGQLPLSLPHLLGILVALHEGGPALCDPTGLPQHEAAILDVAERVQLAPEPAWSILRLTGLRDTIGPVFGEVPLGERIAFARNVGLGALRASRGGFVGVSAREAALTLTSLLRRGHPSLRIGPTDRWGTVAPPRPSSIRLGTPDGSWAETRATVEGGPARRQDDLRRVVVGKFARGRAWRFGRSAAIESGARARAEVLLRSIGHGAPTASEALTMLVEA